VKRRKLIKGGGRGTSGGGDIANFRSCPIRDVATDRKEIKGRDDRGEDGKGIKDAGLRGGMKGGAG